MKIRITLQCAMLGIISFGTFGNFPKRVVVRSSHTTLPPSGTHDHMRLKGLWTPLRTRFTSNLKKKTCVSTGFFYPENDAADQPLFGTHLNLIFSCFFKENF